MKKHITKVILKLLKSKQYLRGVLLDNKGSSVLTDNAGLIIAGLVIIAIVITSVKAWTDDSFLPWLFQKIMGLLN